MTIDEAFKIISDWINASKTYQQRLIRKQIAFVALYASNPQVTIDFAKGLNSEPPNTPPEEGTNCESPTS